MFSGLIQSMGTVFTNRGADFAVKARFPKAKAGDSIAINGVCLTLTHRPKNGVGRFKLSTETKEKTTLARLKPGQTVNIEPALGLKDALGGHIVQGHVDDVGRVKKIKATPTTKTIEFEAPAALMKYVVPKGSIAVDGVSLTAITVSKSGFAVALIPHTLRHTNLKTLNVGDAVNLEADIMAKYVERFIKRR